jgi:very-short-patch-repair endonuclease
MPLRVDVEAAAELSLAMIENAVPLVARLALTNDGDERLQDLVVELALLPDFSAKWSTHISAIPPGGTFTLDEIELPVDRVKLVNQLERARAELVLWVRAKGHELPINSATIPVDVLAYNEWSQVALPPLLAAFVLPNHPAVGELLRGARDQLQVLTGDPALEGYQARDPQRIVAMATAIYQAVQMRGITYSNPPASFEDRGQKIRTPEQLIGGQLGTCLDISVLVAAALEQAGLHPLICIVRGHAFPGVWLEDHFVPEAIIDDAAMIRKLVDLGRVLVFDSSTIVAKPPVPFAEAKRVAARYLETSTFRHAVDVKGARKQHFRPLPMRVEGGFAPAIEVPVIVPASGPAAIPRPANAADGSGRSRGSARTRHPRVEQWKQKLLDTTLRNRLLNFKETKQTIDLLCADLGTVEDALASSEDLRIKPRPPLLGGDDPRSRKLIETRVADDAFGAFLRERFAHGELYTTQTTDATTSRLTTIYRAARTALEETGANSLCLTLGMLHWYESDSSQVLRRAPVLLLPVVMTRNAREGGYTIRATGEDARLNVTLIQKLKADWNLEITELDELPLDQAGVDVPAVLQTVRSAVLNLRRWDVKPELHLGLFSFAKFQMWADLDQHADALLANTVVSHLLNGNREPFPNAGSFIEPHELDRKLSPKDLLCPLDADASQLAAVAAAADGKTFVLQGPPGTGKSQTITNLITHCIAKGKRVLFVAEKAAALDVVQRRLAQVGLGPYVLELHSHKSGKQQVLDQFREALEAAPASPPATWDEQTAKLSEERTHLNAYVDAMHRTHASGFSVFHALAKLDALRDIPRCEAPASCADSRERFDHLKHIVEDLSDVVRKLGAPSRSAWATCKIPAWSVELLSRVSDALDTAHIQLTSAKLAGERLAARLRTGPPTTFADVDAICAVAQALVDAPVHGEALLAPAEWHTLEPIARSLATRVRAHSEGLALVRARYSESIFALDLDGIGTRIQRYARSFALFAWWGLRGVRKVLGATARDGRRPDRARLASDVDAARSVRDLGRELTAAHTQGKSIYGHSWKGGDSDAAMLEATLSWGTRLRELASRLRAAPPKLEPADDLAALAESARTSLAALRATIADVSKWLGWTAPRSDDDWVMFSTTIDRWRGELHLLRSWYVYQTATAELRTAGCNALVDAVAAGTASADALPGMFLRGVYDAWARRTMMRDPVLQEFDGERHKRRIGDFAALDRKLLTDSKTVARAQVARRAPTATTATGGELGLLQRELQKKKRHMPIRKLLAETSSLVARLKPCFLMSPMSVASYLDLRTTKFDIVVFDEASQIPTHDAIGVLARGESAVVVGDSKQLPPTMFFHSEDDSDDEMDSEELESILDECSTAGFPQRQLDWHYRSRHESLIVFSNSHYYNNRLNTFPSSSERGTGRGVHLRPVTGFYDKGGARTNKAEAEAVVADLLSRVRAEASRPRRPDEKPRSFGVVTFSQAQQTLVEDLLEETRKQFPETDAFFDKEATFEPVIVKNLENIQGDERDVMIFSICYGPDQYGKVSMNFGPLNRDGGERRLNVAITRAREELVVYATVTPDQIDLTRTKAVGVKHLKRFLDYAQRGPIAIVEAVNVGDQDQFDSPFEEQVCERLRMRGHTVQTQVGCAGYRLDIAVCDPDAPGRYLLAVECDGAHYHSARSARERDRLRAQVLEGLGWRIHRVWSTDWWQAPEREIEKVEAAIERARIAPREEPPPPPTPQVLAPTPAPRTAERKRTSVPIPAPASDFGMIAQAPTTTASTVSPYRVARIPSAQRMADDVHDETLREELRALLHSVIEVEAPVSLRVLGRRIAPYFGIQRTTNRLEDRLRSVLGRSVKINDDIVWRVDQNPETYSGARSATPEARREAPEVPLEEVANAALDILRGCIALDHEELVKLTAKVLGFGRTGERVADHVASGLALLVKRGRASREGTKIVLV